VILAVQVKCGLGRLRPPEWNALVDLAGRYGMIPVLAERADRQPMRWWELTGPKVLGGRGPQPYRPIVVADQVSEATKLARLAEVSGVNPIPAAISPVDQIARGRAYIRERYGPPGALE
jgi:hypothetical protein